MSMPKARSVVTDKRDRGSGVEDEGDAEGLASDLDRANNDDTLLDAHHSPLLRLRASWWA
jgi:hypothetical protein